jgi:hypothetical protein
MIRSARSCGLLSSIHIFVGPWDLAHRAIAQAKISMPNPQDTSE